MVVDKGGLKVVGDSFAEVLQDSTTGSEGFVFGRGGWVLLTNEWKIVGRIIDI
jgi:hypothetical protein